MECHCGRHVAEAEGRSPRHALAKRFDVNAAGCGLECFAAPRAGGDECRLDGGEGCEDSRATLVGAVDGLGSGEADGDFGEADDVFDSDPSEGGDGGGDVDEGADGGGELDGAGSGGRGRHGK